MDYDNHITAVGCPAGHELASRLGLAGLLQIAAPGWRIDGVAVLPGGTSARIWRVHLRDAQGARSSVVVRLANERTLLAGQDRVWMEVAALRAVQAAGVPVPRVLAADLTGRLLGQPALALEYLCGATGLEVRDPVDAAKQLARSLASIHTVPIAAVLALPRPAGLIGPQSTAAPCPHVLLHGDFWPGNTIWRDDQLVGVIDWEDAAIGHPLADVANARLEITWFWGRPAAEEFTAEYVRSARRSVADLAAWDIATAQHKASQIDRWGLAPAQVTAMRAELAAFVARARSAASPATGPGRLA